MANHLRFWRNRHHVQKNIQGEPDPASGITLLCQLEIGQKAIIAGFRGGPGFISRMATLGFVPGTEVEMLQNYGKGPVIVSVRGTHVALGRRESCHIHLNHSSS